MHVCFLAPGAYLVISEWVAGFDLVCLGCVFFPKFLYTEPLTFICELLLSNAESYIILTSSFEIVLQC